MRLAMFAAGVAVVAALATCSIASAADETLVVQSWGGATTAAEKAAFYDPFTAKTGIKIQIVEAGSTAGATLKKQIQSGRVTWDVVTGFPPETIGLFNTERLLGDLDFKHIPTADKLSPGAKLPYAVGYDVETIVPAFSTRAGIKPLKSMADFFDVKNFPGPRMAPNWGTASMQCELALTADGVPADKLYPLDVKRCFEIWDRVKSSVTVWYSSGSQMAQALVEDAVDYCMCWDGRVQQALQTNDKWDYVFDGAMSYFDYAGIVKGSKNVAAAEKLIELMSSAEAQAEYSKIIKYGPSNPAAIAMLPEAMRKRSAAQPENQKFIFLRPADRVAEINAGNEALERAWASWIAK